jgi:hypothetical protein
MKNKDFISLKLQTMILNYLDALFYRKNICAVLKWENTGSKTLT